MDNSCQATVKKYLKKCITCKIVQGKTLKPPDCSLLPKFRLECNHAFENVGLDYAGPLFIKKKGKVQKCYILLFTCELLERYTWNLYRR